MKRYLWLAGIMLGWPAMASAITVDGVVDAEYGSPLAVQTTPTQYGDNQSELDAIYAKLDGSGNLSLMLTGNIQNNGNGIVVMIDSRLGGAVASSQTDNYGVIGSVGGDKTDNWGSDTDGGAAVSTPPGGGSVLDPGFNPDMALTFSHSGSDYYMNVIDMTLPNDDVHPDKDVYHDYYHVSDGTLVDHVYTRTDTNAAKGHGTTITTALNNLNSAGVTDTDASAALSATTGMEIQLQSAFLSNAGQPIRVMAFITGGDGGYLSNQFLPGLKNGSIGNLDAPGGTGGTPLFDAHEFVDNVPHFVTVGTPGTSGDYDQSGTVDAADYLAWRTAVGNTPVEYDAWRAGFGNTDAAAIPGLTPGNVPEPTTLSVAMLGMFVVAGIARRKRAC